MPTNLPERAKAKWAEAQGARAPAVKLKLLREFYSMIPKHKGAEKLEVSIKKQIKSLEEEVERARKRRKGSSRSEWVVTKDGMLQLGVTGSLPSSRTLFVMLTKMSVRDGEMLVRPVVGIFERDSLRIQVVLAPYDKTIGEEKQNRFVNLLRNVDVIAIALGSDPMNYVHELLEWFETQGIEVLSPNLAAEVLPTSSGGIRVVGRSTRSSEGEIVAVLSSYGIKNAVVKVSNDTTTEDVEAAVFERIRKSAVFVTLTEYIKDELSHVIPGDLIQESSVFRDRIAGWFLNKLNLIRVYTKGIGGEKVDRPLLLREGSTVIDAAEMVHKDLVKFFRYAKLWRDAAGSPIRVGARFELKDGDTVEIHAI